MELQFALQIVAIIGGVATILGFMLGPSLYLITRVDALANEMRKDMGEIKEEISEIRKDVHTIETDLGRKKIEVTNHG